MAAAAGAVLAKGLALQGAHVHLNFLRSLSAAQRSWMNSALAESYRFKRSEMGSAAWLHTWAMGFSGLYQLRNASDS